MNLHFSAVILLLLVPITACIGCGDSKRVVTEDGAEIEVSERGDQFEMTVSGEDGEETVVRANQQGMQFPEEWPADVATYPDAKIVTTAVTAQGIMVGLETSDSAETVLNFQKEKLTAEGWNIKMKTQTSEGGMVMATKETRSVNVVVSGSGQATSINMMVGGGA
jgi:hypothetical protein